MRIIDFVSSRTAKVRGLFAAAAIGLLASAGAANAITVTGNYTVTYQASAGQNGTPTFKNPSNSLANSSSSGGGTTSFTGNFSYGTSTLAAGLTKNLVEIDPSTSCGSGCGSWPGPYTQTGTVTVTFSFTTPAISGGPSLNETGVYTARYSYPTLACAASDSASTHGKSDCIAWNNDPDPITISFADGNMTDTLSISLIDAIDWNITPTVTLALTQTPPQGETGQAPLPGALPLFVSGAGALGLVGWRRKRRLAKETKRAA